MLPFMKTWVYSKLEFISALTTYFITYYNLNFIEVGTVTGLILKGIISLPFVSITIVVTHFLKRYLNSKFPDKTRTDESN